LSQKTVFAATFYSHFYSSEGEEICEEREAGEEQAAGKKRAHSRNCLPLVFLAHNYSSQSHLLDFGAQVLLIQKTMGSKKNIFFPFYSKMH
jgi:hypothetical protein